MFLAVLSAIALTVGSAMTIHDLSQEKAVAQQSQSAVVEVAPLQSQETQKPEINH